MANNLENQVRIIDFHLETIKAELGLYSAAINKLVTKDINSKTAELRRKYAIVYMENLDMEIKRDIMQRSLNDHFLMATQQENYHRQQRDYFLNNDKKILQTFLEFISTLDDEAEKARGKLYLINAQDAQKNTTTTEEKAEYLRWLVILSTEMEMHK
jgi:hypothetical protein